MFSSSSFCSGNGYIKIISMWCKVINIKSRDMMCGDMKRAHSPSSSNASVRFGPESPKGVAGLKIAWRTALSCAEAMMPRSVKFMKLKVQLCGECCLLQLLPVTSANPARGRWGTRTLRPARTGHLCTCRPACCKALNTTNLWLKPF